MILEIAAAWAVLAFICTLIFVAMAVRSDRRS